MKKRLFTFGCSYTKYAWPTWADMLGLDYEESYNWGLPGLGNRAIAERVAEAHARHQFTKDDLIIVQWSSHLRNDFWHKYSLPDRVGGWKTSGSVFNFINEKLYDQKWIDTFFYEPAYLMHTLNNIVLTQGLLNSIGCTWYMTSMGDVRNMGADLRTHMMYGEQGNFTNPFDANITNVAWKKMPNMAFYNKTIWEDHSVNWLMPLEHFCKQSASLNYGYTDDTFKGTGDFEQDLHPTPTQAIMWIEQELKDKINVSQETLNKSKLIADKVDKHYHLNNYSKVKFSIELNDKDFFKDVVPDLEWPSKDHGF